MLILMIAHAFDKHGLIFFHNSMSSDATGHVTNDEFGAFECFDLFPNVVRTTEGGSRDWEPRQHSLSWW